MCAKIRYINYLSLVKKQNRYTYMLYFFFSLLHHTPNGILGVNHAKIRPFTKENDCSINSRLVIYLLFSNGRTGEAK